MAATTFMGADIWYAYAAKGKPIAVAGKGTDKHPEGLSVSIYFSKKGRLKGVTVWDGDAEEFIASVGKVPSGEDE